MKGKIGVAGALSLASEGAKYVQVCVPLSLDREPLGCCASVDAKDERGKGERERMEQRETMERKGRRKCATRLLAELKHVDATLLAKEMG